MLDYESAKIKLSLPKHGNESPAEHHDQLDYKEAAQIRQLAEDATKAERRAERPARRQNNRRDEEQIVAPQIEKTTLGDLSALQALKEKMQKDENNG